jgi:probable phosphoglycerate mutase
VNTAVVHIDGGCRPINPGHAGIGVVILLGGEEFILSRYLGWPRSNNFAEFTALIVAIKYARHLGAEALEVVSDSKLVVEQVHGRWRLRSAELKPLVMEARDLLFRHFPHRWELNWSARANNVKADYYCGLAIEAGRNRNPWHRPQKEGKILDPFSLSTTVST